MNFENLTVQLHVIIIFFIVHICKFFLKKKVNRDDMFKFSSFCNKKLYIKKRLLIN